MAWKNCGADASMESNGVCCPIPACEGSPRGPYNNAPPCGGDGIKYLVVTGGTMSGLGKGTTISSIGVTLKALGLRVTVIKVDPYLNVDAGTMSPYEHGEVYVLEDGGEVDLDLGNYERFLGVTLSKVHNLTSGKLFQSVLASERRGAYLGKTVQVVPQVTDAVQQWLASVARLPVEDKVDDESSSSHSHSHSSSHSNSISSGGSNSNRSSSGGSARPDVCLIEVGGTVGDIESALYLEALQQFCRKVGSHNFCLCHVSYVPTVSGEQKTKPTQHGVKELRMAGLKPDMIFCRCETMLCEASRSKIALFSQVLPEHVISVHDVSNTYRVPQVLHEQGVAASICKLLRLEPRVAPPASSGALPRLLQKWNTMAERLTSPAERVRIGIVGKYTGLADSYLSVVKALQHGAMEAGLLLDIVWIESSELEKAPADAASSATVGVPSTSAAGEQGRAPSPASSVSGRKQQQEQGAAWEALRSVQGVVCPGGFGDRGIAGKAASAGYCRRNGVPYLGICLGMQTAVIDFAKDVLQLHDANSEEFDSRCANPVVVAMPEHTSATQSDIGGTMRLGKRATIIRDPGSLAARLYDGKPVIDERHRHRFEVNPLYVKALEAKGFKFVGQNERGQRMEIAELQGHPFFLCVQYHPEFTSRPLRPSPLFLGLIMAAAGKLQERLEKYNGYLRSGATYDQFY